jgi:predicted XRE-type DNA-binding protein
MIINRFTSVWDAIEDTPEKAENMKLRSPLMIALNRHLIRTGVKQAQIAKLFGVTQPSVSEFNLAADWHLLHCPQSTPWSAQVHRCQYFLAHDHSRGISGIDNCRGHFRSTP